jgi:AcrR family transcriptional regulator
MRITGTVFPLASDSWLLDTEVIPMPPKPVDKDRKRREIAAAAMDVFSRSGFEASSMRQVAEHAGVGKGTIYEYFRSKEDLVAAIQIWTRQVILATERSVQGIGDPGDKLRAYVNATLDNFLGDDKVPHLILSILQFFLTRIHDTSCGEVMREMSSAGVDSITAIFVEGIKHGVFRITDRREARIAAVNLAAYLDGICIDYLATGRSFDLKEQAGYYLENLLERKVEDRSWNPGVSCQKAAVTLKHETGNAAPR